MDPPISPDPTNSVDLLPQEESTVTQEPSMPIIDTTVPQNDPTGPPDTLDPNQPHDASEASLASSFVPIEHCLEAVQLIDENKVFNTGVLDYISGNNSFNGEHRIVAVFGSQSTGKSTLLNHLFNTNFGVMDETSRQQTTKGIWLAVSPGVSSNTPYSESSTVEDKIVVMDVEGTDGTERGEDQDFERKAALFALATSEVLIVNLWETQVGWYQGANMGLIKTVFEVNLSLFGRAKLESSSDHKVLLLFVIRDHTGRTSKESLSATLTRDLLRIWDSLNKPAELVDLKFSDFFDLAFHTLSHKIFQNEEFIKDVKLLGDRFVHRHDKEFLFKPNYCHNIPIEGWTMYAESCWDQIDSNKDLDLPTQQIMVARCKCEELAALSFETFDEAFEELHEEAMLAVDASKTLDSPVLDYDAIGQALLDAKDDALADYDAIASKYNHEVYEQRRDILTEKIVAKLHIVVLLYAELLNAKTAEAFAAKLSKRGKTRLIDAITVARETLLKEYNSNLLSVSLGDDKATSAFKDRLDAELLKVEAEQKVAELSLIAVKYLKKLSTALNNTVQSEFSQASDETWKNIKERFEGLRETLLQKYKVSEDTYDFGIGAEPQMTTVTLDTLEFKSWEVLQAAIKKFASKDNLFNILKDRFDEKFGYDVNGNPRVYLNTSELETAFVAAKNWAMEALPNLAITALPDGNKFQPSVNLNSASLKRKYESVASALKAGDSVEEEEESDSDDEDAKLNFVEAISEKDLLEALQKFKRETDSIFVSRKGAIVPSRTQIPYYIYLVILVLGWNEFLAVIRNPFFFSMLLILGAAVYGMYQTNLLGPAMVVGQRMIDEAVSLAKQKLREFVVDDHEAHSRNLKKMSSEPGSIELEDLSRAHSEETDT